MSCTPGGGPGWPFLRTYDGPGTEGRDRKFGRALVACVLNLAKVGPLIPPSRKDRRFYSVFGLESDRIYVPASPMFLSYGSSSAWDCTLNVTRSL